MTPSPIDRAAAAAAEEVRRVIGHEYARRNFTITKFGRHPDGYLHARITLNGEAVYVHRRHGSWLMPGHRGNKPVLREVLSPYKEALQEKARPFDQAARREREAGDAQRKRTERATDTGGDSAPLQAAGVPEGGDDSRSDDAVQLREE